MCKDILKQYKWKLKDNENSYYKEKLKKEITNPKRYWKTINQITGLVKLSKWLI